MSEKMYSKTSASSKLSHLLSNSEESPSTRSKESMFSTFAVDVDSYEFPTADRVPAGYYIAEIDKVDVRVKKGVKILDVSYCIWNDDGQHYILQSYPEKTVHLKRFFEAMAAAGIKPGADPRETRGVKEKIDLEYWSDYSDIGSIVKRMPYHPKPELDEAEEK